MKRSLGVWSSSMVLALALTAGACGKKEVKPAPPPPPAPAPAPATTTPKPPPPAPPPPASKPVELSADDKIKAMSLDELNKGGFLTDVFYALDSIELSQEARGAIQKNAEFLKRFPSFKIMIEGHADSRGTNEYNLALAERRAGAARDYIVGLGIPADRVTIVSKGEEAPFCTEEAESCWSQNRRGHFVITAK